jgi:hypothetical protein
MTYKDRLLALNLLSLAFDREIKDLTFMFKTLHGFYDLDVSILCHPPIIVVPVIVIILL